jgi:hypothetical protein
MIYHEGNQRGRKTQTFSNVCVPFDFPLRHYFSLRRQLGPSYLHLLRFFLNHHPYRRSRRPERVGKSPAQLLGHDHPHWLAMLGYQRFARN